jgi:ketosteroid isomerase-like protein
VPKTRHDAARELVESYISVLEGRNLAGVISHFDPNIVVTIPMSLTGGTEPWFVFDGIGQVTDYWANAIRTCERIAFSDRTLTVSEDATTVFVEATGDMLLAGGEKYRNVYVFRFDLADGKIFKITEYGNPVTVANMSGGASLDDLGALPSS